MKKRVVAALLLATVVLAGCGAQGSGNDGSDKTEASKEADAGYVFENNGAEVSIDEKADEAKKALGDPKVENEMPSCAFGDLDKVYEYNDFDMYSYRENDVDYIYDIVLKTDVVSTAEGVSIGDTSDKVKDIYGDADKEDSTLLSYHKGNMNLMFIINNDEVISIEYASDRLDN